MARAKGKKDSGIKPGCGRIISEREILHGCDQIFAAVTALTSSNGWHEHLAASASAGRPVPIPPPSPSIGGLIDIVRIVLRACYQHRAV